MLMMMIIVIMMLIASYTDDDDRHYDDDFHHDNNCMQARVFSRTPAAAAPIESRIILSLGAAAAGIFPGDILLMGAAVAVANKGTMGLGLHIYIFIYDIFPTMSILNCSKLLGLLIKFNFVTIGRFVF